MIKIDDYKKIVGREKIETIKKKAKRLRGKRIVAISSSHQGGGVAEIMNSAVLIFNDLEIDFGWRIIQGSPDFYSVTKKIHNGLQGAEVKLSKADKKMYVLTNERFASFTNLTHDLVVVHDPQPLAMIRYYKKKQPWIWRCHVDLSSPNKEMWEYVQSFIENYDAFVVSREEYKKEMKVAQKIIMPAIDPNSPKNKGMSQIEAEKILEEHNITFDKPLIAQISRFDKWKDPEGVIRVFDRVAKKVPCRLVLLGNMAMDDPEGAGIYRKILEKYGKHPNIEILVNVNDNDRVVNALQRKAGVIIQKSIREGFGLTVSEALFKGTPVVASKAGGVPLQVKDGESGFLYDVKDEKGMADGVVRLLEHKQERNEFGTSGKEYVRENFLITRLIDDWLDLFGQVMG